MSPFDLIGRYFWLIALAVGGINYLVATRRIESSGAEDPRATAEAKVLRRSFAVISAVPWIVMGVGELVGGVPNIWSYFRPQDGNRYVLAWFGTIFLISVAFVYWVFFCGGAKKAIELQLFPTRSTTGKVALTPGRVKFFAVLGPAWIALWVLLVVSMDTPISK